MERGLLGIDGRSLTWQLPDSPSPFMERGGAAARGEVTYAVTGRARSIGAPAARWLRSCWLCQYDGKHGRSMYFP